MGSNPTEDQSKIWERIRALCQAAIQITSEHELDRVLQTIVESARNVIGARYAALGVLNLEEGGIGTFVASGLTEKQREEIGAFPQGKGILGIVISNPRPIRLKDLTEHPSYTGFPEHHPIMKSFLGVSIPGRSDPIGNLYLADKLGAAEFSEQDQAVAVMLAAHAGVAVENARLFEERERLVEELKASNESRQRFFAMINHEMRNAITAVYGWAELWLRKEGDNAPRFAVEVYESAERAVKLLEDVLALSRLDAKQITPSVEDADATDIVRDALRTVEPAAARKGIKLSTTAPDGKVACRTDPQRVLQILVNLLTNAVRHSSESATVTVKLTADDDTIRFDTIDHGEGIPLDQQSLIFEAFERAGKETTSGTGLGLTVSRTLAVRMGGDLSVKSRPGKGARFILELPRFPSGKR